MMGEAEEVEVAQWRCVKGGIALFLKWCRFGLALGTPDAGLWNVHCAQTPWAVADLDGLSTSSKFGHGAPMSYKAGV